MNLDALHRTSLRRTLIAVLLAGVFVGGLLQVYATWRTAEAAVNAAFDRSLYGAIRAIDANVSTESGGIGVELPYLLFEFFELTASGAVHYRVATDDGLVEIGSPDMPKPKGPFALGRPQFQTVEYLGRPTRVGTYVRPLSGTLGGPSAGNLVIQVAEPLTSRNAFSQRFIFFAIARDVLLAGLAAGAVAVAVTWSLRPLRQLRDEVLARRTDDLSPIDTRRVPADVLPLVEAMNDHLLRYRALLATQRQFLDDASHQLRTPLATLLTQVSYAQREADAGKVRETLNAMRQQLKRTVRQANQLLALARADTSELQARPTELNKLAGEVTRRFWQGARGQGIDLGFDAAAAPVVAAVHPALVEEALSNLIDNAVRHTPPGGHVTVRVGGDAEKACIEVADTGPGIPEAELPLATQRFFRASNTRGQGSGLGLAIAQSIALRHRGRLLLSAASGEGGLRARIELPAADHTPASVLQTS